MNREVSREYGEIAQSIAPVGIVMSVFCLVYSIWFGFAWGAPGWAAFLMITMIVIYIISVSIKNINHSKKFTVYESEASRKINKSMGKLSVVTYSAVWVFIILLFLLGQRKFILPAVTLIIGLHFIPQGKIMNRKIDYIAGPFPILSSLIAFYYGFFTEMDWIEVYAVAGVGGAIATLIYGFYIINTYKKTAQQYQVD